MRMRFLATKVMLDEALDTFASRKSLAQAMDKARNPKAKSAGRGPKRG